VCIGLYCLCIGVQAWDNSTENPDYNLLVHGNYFQAVMKTYTEAFGGGTKGQIFYLILPALPYLMLWMATKDIFIPNTLLMFFAWIYRAYVPAVGWPIIVLLIGFSVVATLVRIFSPMQPD
jgi:hypothetical protein